MTYRHEALKTTYGANFGSNRYGGFGGGIEVGGAIDDAGELSSGKDLARIERLWALTARGAWSLKR